MEIAHWKKNTRGELTKADAQTVYEELRSLGKSLNLPFQQVPCQEIVDYARNHPGSEIHGIMEWNDTIAAENYRKKQASTIKTCLYTYTYDDGTELRDSDGKLVEMPLYATPQSEVVKTHAPMTLIMSDVDERNKLVQKALRDFQERQARWAHFEEFRLIYDAIDKTAAMLANNP